MPDHVGVERLQAKNGLGCRAHHGGHRGPMRADRITQRRDFDSHDLAARHDNRARHHRQHDAAGSGGVSVLSSTDRSSLPSAMGMPWLRRRRNGIVPRPSRRLQTGLCETVQVGEEGVFGMPHDVRMVDRAGRADAGLGVGLHHVVDAGAGRAGAGRAGAGRGCGKRRHGPRSRRPEASRRRRAGSAAAPGPAWPAGHQPRSRQHRPRSGRARSPGCAVPRPGCRRWRARCPKSARERRGSACSQGQVLPEQTAPTAAARG